MAPISDTDRLFMAVEKVMERLGSLESRFAVIEDQNRAQFRELQTMNKNVSSLSHRCETRHSELEEDRYQKHGRLGERLQRLETVLWLLGSGVSLLALILGGGVLVRLVGN